MVEAASGFEEATWMASKILDLQAGGHPLEQMAVLFRVHVLSRVLEQALVRL